jgi:hypothetical protein
MSSLAPIRGSDDVDGDVQPYADLPGTIVRVTPAGTRDPELEPDHVSLGSASTTSTRNRQRPPLPCSRGRGTAGDRERRDGRPPLSPVAGIDGLTMRG